MKEIQKRLRERKASEKGFTLVELMIVIAIIAILAAVAISQYSAYKNKAKAKELVGFARACAMEIVSQCAADEGFNDASSLESCSAYDGNNTKYITNIQVDESGFTACNSDFQIVATGNVGGTSYKVVCSYNATTTDVSCTAPQKGT